MVITETYRNTKFPSSYTKTDTIATFLRISVTVQCRAKTREDVLPHSVQSREPRRRGKRRAKQNRL